MQLCCTFSHLAGLGKHCLRRSALIFSSPLSPHCPSTCNVMEQAEKYFTYWCNKQILRSQYVPSSAVGAWATIISKRTTSLPSWTSEACLKHSRGVSHSMTVGAVSYPWEWQNLCRDLCRWGSLEVGARNTSTRSAAPSPHHASPVLHTLLLL